MYKGEFYKNGNYYSKDEVKHGGGSIGDIKIIIPTINALNYGYCTFDAEWNLTQNIPRLQC